MPASTIAILAIYFGFALLELWRTRLFAKPEQTSKDGWVEGISMAMLIGLTQPAILLTVMALGNWLAPQWAGALAGINVFAAIALFLVLDDMTQYWWHRNRQNQHRQRR